MLIRISGLSSLKLTNLADIVGLTRVSLFEESDDLLIGISRLFHSFVFSETSRLCSITLVLQWGQVISRSMFKALFEFAY
jgi:hypothetical protein